MRSKYCCKIIVCPWFQDTFWNIQRLQVDSTWWPFLPKTHVDILALQIRHTGNSHLSPNYEMSLNWGRWTMHSALCLSEVNNYAKLFQNALKNCQGLKVGEADTNFIKIIIGIANKTTWVYEKKNNSSNWGCSTENIHWNIAQNLDCHFIFLMFLQFFYFLQTILSVV